MTKQTIFYNYVCIECELYLIVGFVKCNMSIDCGFCMN